MIIYIHYVGHSDDFDQWKKNSENRRDCIFKRYEKKANFIQYDFDDNDLDNEEGSLWYFEKKKENKSVNNDNGNSNIDASNNDKDEDIEIKQKLQENNELVKNLKSEVATLKEGFNSEIATLKNLVEALISEIKNAKNNSGNGKNEDEDQEK